MLPLTQRDLGRRGVIATTKDWIRLAFSDKNSRNLAAFLLLNLSFAFVELFYGIVTNSLGLISDSFHMFFDCTGLLAGLVATVITKWRADEKFTYGYVRAEVMAGFVNGLFLLFISFFIFSEAVERAVEPPEVKHERLFVVSVLGFLVNLVGIFVFHHGHGHSHGGGSSGDKKSDYEQPSLLLQNGDINIDNNFIPVTGFEKKNQYGHGHSHNHSDGHSHLHNSSDDHSHSNHGHSSHGHSHDLKGSNSVIMKGVFLHILADALGSVGVIVSAILMQLFGWMIADPICSMFIALLIAVSVFSLIKESIGILMQRQPRELDHLLPGAYSKVSQLPGVISVQEQHFWTLCSEVYIGSLKIEVTSNADPRYIIRQTHSIFNSIGVKKLTVQLDYLN